MNFGIDVSHHNFATWDLINADFTIVKATEGRTYTDPSMVINSEKALAKSKYIGFYHYARPENNTAREEADHFSKKVNAIIKNRDCKPLVALDFEGNALHWQSVNERIDWINTFVKYVEELTGLQPLIYMSSSASKIHKALFTETNNRLWVAHYGVESPSVPEGVTPVLWQYTNNYEGKSVDGNKVIKCPIEWARTPELSEIVDIEKVKESTQNLINVLTEFMRSL